MYVNPSRFIEASIARKCPYGEVTWTPTKYGGRLSADFSVEKEDYSAFNGDPIDDVHINIAVGMKVRLMCLREEISGIIDLLERTENLNL